MEIEGVNMKIGEFSIKYDITIDAIRHYMDIGIITPMKKGGHYDFDKHAQEQITMILELKSFDFSLSEIRSVMLYKSLSPLIFDDEVEFKRNLYDSKQKNIKKEIKRLEDVDRNLKNKLNGLNSGNNKSVKLGLPIEAVSLFNCPKCKKELDLNASKIIKGEVFVGELVCECGFKLEIKDGIVFDDSCLETNEPLNQTDILLYLEETPVSYLIETMKLINWLSDDFIKQSFSNKVVLDVGTGHGLFVRSIFNDISENCILICNDILKESVVFVKNAIEKSGIRKKVVFLACDMNILPLKNESVDVLSAVGTPTLLLEKELSLMSHVDQFMKKKSELFILECVYDQVDPSNVHLSGLKEQLRKESLEKNYESIGYVNKNSRRSGILPCGGKYEPLIKAKDKSYMYGIYYKR